MTQIINVPGIGNSGKEHWQTYWETTDPSIIRMVPSNWDQPNLPDWLDALDRAVGNSPAQPILVAHSLGCLLVAHWQSVSTKAVLGAFLVAVPDPTSDVFPSEASNFTPGPEGKLRFPSLVVASKNDPFASLAYSQSQAEKWGSDFVEVGKVGHINGKSGLGSWPEGVRMLKAFDERISKSLAGSI